MQRDRGVSLWLWSLWGLVLVMVAVGGITRLTGSGLSMVDWRPLMGTLPPLSEVEWQRVFGQYQQSPQFQQVNHWMTLADFKRIFLWEYVHRALGRLVGIWFALPFGYFLWRGRLRGRAVLLTGLAFVLGGAQGLLGWYMVKSGLVSRPEVSHLRLAAHLGLAFFVGQYLLWLAFRFNPRLGAAAGRLPRIFIPLWALIFAQVIYGAFMAGTHAGLLFSTFPDMNGQYLPQAFFRFPSLLENLIHSPMAIHWMHRTLGALVLLFATLVYVQVQPLRGSGPTRTAGHLFIAMTMLQFLLGVGTVVMAVPLWMAAIHQVGAYLLLSSAVAFGFLARLPSANNGGNE